MVNYSWGDVWDERQKHDDIRRFYGPNGSSSGSYPVKPSGGGYSYRKPSRNHRGRNIAVILGILVACGGFAYVFNLLDIQTLVVAPISSGLSSKEPDNSQSSAEITSITAPSKQIKHVEYVTEDETKVLLDRGTFLSRGGDSATFDIQIPNKDVTYLSGTITVQGSKSVHIEFTDSYGIPYCDECVYDVYSSRPEEVKIPVDSGDSILVKVTNPKDADLQTVNFELSVTYPETKEKITYEKVEQEQVSTAPKSIPTVTIPIPTAPQPTIVYTKCDFGIMEQGSRASCAEPKYKVLLLETTPKLKEVLAKAGFRIGEAPPTALFRDVTVEQYDEKNFVVIIKDPVGEKHYPTQLWELPS